MGPPTHVTRVPRGRPRVAAAVVAATLTFVGCSASHVDPTSAGKSSPDASPTRDTSPAEGSTARVRRLVVLISVDGLNPAAIRERGTRTSSGAPTFAALTRDAVGTLEARSTLEQTNTLPNHSSMLTGRPVAGPTGTGVVFNSDNGETLRASAGQYVPGVFDVVHDHGLPTALFAEKDKFQFLVRSWDASNGAEDVTGVDDGRRKIDEVLIAPAAQLLPAVERRLRSGRGGLIFLHVAAPDYAGHATGFMSPRYLDAVDTAADEVATVLGVVRAAPACGGARR